ncbi:MAG: porin family protein [Tardiphaga sp.]|nr:porin family protein [Tardiphaga sp.]
MKRFLLGLAGVVGLAGPAVAADLPARIYAKAPIADPVYNWTGLYLGVNAGGAWGRSAAATSTVFSPTGYFAATSVPAIALAGNQQLNGSGFTGGLTAGYNWQSSNIVFGLGADFNYLGLKASSSGSAVYPCCAPTSFTVASSVATDWLMTFRPRLGLAHNNWLFYVTGGLAVANVKGNFVFTDTFATAAESAAFSRTKAGWTAGAGVEYALLNGWSVKGEYLHIDLGSESTTSSNLTAFTPTIAFASNAYRHSVDLKSDVVRVGLNYKFGGR